MPDKEQVEIPVLEHPRLRETGNGANVSYEEGVLRQYFGEPDENGVYGAVSSDES